MNKITFSQAIDGYLLFANARRLSHHTIRDYTTTFRKFLDFLDEDPPVEEITSKQVESFLAAQSVTRLWRKMNGLNMGRILSRMAKSQTTGSNRRKSHAHTYFTQFSAITVNDN